MTYVRHFREFRELAGMEPDWNRLAADQPLRNWSWLGEWWQHYGPADGASGRELFVLGVFAQNHELIGVAPWYVTRSGPLGRVVRFLGDGEVCTDYLGLLCRPEHENNIVATLAQWLLDDRPTVSEWLSGAKHHRWDLLELRGVDAQDRAVLRLAQELETRGAIAHARPGPSCWRLTLPATWDDFVATLSKSHRKQVRRAERRMFDSGRTVVRWVRQPQDLDAGWDVLVDLHQRRRQQLGEPGRFSSQRFAEFHRGVMQDHLAAGSLRLFWLELDGRPIAAEYSVAGNGVVYAYQSGVEPRALDDEPGNLAAIAAIKAAIADGFREMDFLRGDEAYKPHWGATPRPGAEIRVRPGKTADWVRHSMWVASEEVKALLKNGWKAAGEFAATA